ncbi:sugar ABC transporter ATP-binding protein [Rhodococcus rhodochrous]|uniref:ABC transporter ATP-binding protein n=1 Tax=Rhodococcus rhodochrous TaxID=1829 RepID=UPI0009BB2B4D|nr:ABC transporter ATP-binding protein [Rhodococcus rhodochrous]MDO1485114.1 ABC transporter ATP-binding protein [Rhodococcus rhodochrous]SNV09999.1 sugar ABC transporter ATP-binding protein [Rhodococcus rhodochrous]
MSGPDIVTDGPLSEPPTISDEPEPLVLRGITKRYGPVTACEAVDLTVHAAEIHGLLGENGAGKSTLMKILLGLVGPDDGAIFRSGKRVNIDSPYAAQGLGIGMVHQHFSLIDALTVWENVVLGERGQVDRARACADVEAVGARYGLPIDPLATVSELSAGQRQRVELVKCLRRDPQVLILDEPTSVLTSAESQELFTVLRNAVVAEKRSVILISHKLSEIAAATDRVTVLRRGRVVYRGITAETTPEQLARQMVGREVSLHHGGALGADPDQLEVVSPAPVELVTDTVPTLRLSSITLRNSDGRALLDDLSLDVHAGEIVGLYGVEGNGQSELGDLLSGLRSDVSGQVTVDGRTVDLTAPGAMATAGVGVIPEDRHRSGVVLDLSIADNLVMKDLASVSRRGWLDRRTIRDRAAELVRQYNIATPSVDVPLRSLSGGNQQKVVLARELSARPAVLVAAQPTHGLDIGAIEDMYTRLREAADAGVAVLLVSTELEEVMALSDRVAVLSGGRITGVLARAEATSERLGMLLGGEAA